MARRRQRGIDLETPRPLRLVEDIEGVACVVIDRDRTKQLSRQVMVFHLAMMAAFITVFLAPVAWLGALFNILLSPKVASTHIEGTPHGVRLRTLYTRGEPGVSEAREPKSLGPRPLGFGAAEEPRFLPYDAMSSITWTDYSLRFELRGGAVEEVMMELTPPADIARLGEELARARERDAAGHTMSAEEADAERARLARLVQQPQAPR